MCAYVMHAEPRAGLASQKHCTTQGPDEVGQKVVAHVLTGLGAWFFKRGMQHQPQTLEEAHVSVWLGNARLIDFLNLIVY